MPPFPKEALVCRSRAGGNPRNRTACAYVLQALTPGLQDLYCSWSRTNRLQFRRGLSLWPYTVVRVASGSAPSCAVPPVRRGVLSPPFATCLGDCAMHTRVYHSICLVLTITTILVASFPSTTVRAAYQPVSSVVLTVGSPTMSVNGFRFPIDPADPKVCLLYTSDAADDLLCVDLGGRRIIKK